MVGYDQDFYSWTKEQAGLLRIGRFNDLDVKNLLKIVEFMGKSQRKSVQKCLAILLTYMLMWRYSFEPRGVSWFVIIDQQRLKFLKLLKANPSLKTELDNIFLDAYQNAIRQAAKEMLLPFKTFPITPPWTLAESLEEGFYPDS